MNVIRELEDLYPRLFEELPAGSRGRTTENSAAYAGRPDPRKAPVRIEVHDLIAEIEREVPDFARWTCFTFGVCPRMAPNPNTANGRRGNMDARVVAALECLRINWSPLESVAPEYMQTIHDRLARLVARARRMVGETTAPIPLAVPCPECREATVFRVETERGWIAVCGNPVCRDEYGEKHQWTEIEWEDTFAAFRPRSMAGASTPGEHEVR